MFLICFQTWSDISKAAGQRSLLLASGARDSPLSDLDMRVLSINRTNPLNQSGVSQYRTVNNLTGLSGSHTFQDSPRRRVKVHLPNSNIKNERTSTPEVNPTKIQGKSPQNIILQHNSPTQTSQPGCSTWPDDTVIIEKTLIPTPEPPVAPWVDDGIIEIDSDVDYEIPEKKMKLQTKPVTKKLSRTQQGEYDS